MPRSVGKARTGGGSAAATGAGGAGVSTASFELRADGVPPAVAAAPLRRIEDAAVGGKLEPSLRPQREWSLAASSKPLRLFLDTAMVTWSERPALRAQRGGGSGSSTSGPTGTSE